MFEKRRKNRQGGTQKLNASLTKIEKVFEKMYHKKFMSVKAQCHRELLKLMPI
ncbi:hypothetical protein F6Y05_02615 [Bacillus megaterium]|nr:hypothetical protein [Priestia megaterium]